jgi:hypothetical protein
MDESHVVSQGHGLDLRVHTDMAVTVAERVSNADKPHLGTTLAIQAVSHHRRSPLRNVLLTTTKGGWGPQHNNCT